MTFFTLSIITGLSLWPIIGSAELYKWTDQQGNLHITDTPPPGRQKKPGPLSGQPMKATPRPSMTERSRSEVRPVPELSAKPSLSKDQITQPSVQGLSLNLATVTSAWQTFDDSQVIAKAPVQRWQDERGLEHFVDVLPKKKSSSNVEATSGRQQPKMP